MNYSIIKHLIYIIFLSAFLAGVSLYWVFHHHNFTIFPKAKGFDIIYFDSDNLYNKLYFLKNRIISNGPLDEIYFIASHDNEAKQLKGECDYRIKGAGNINAKFWLLTILDENYRPLNMKMKANSSLNSKNTIRFEDGSFNINISPEIKAVNWILSKSHINYRLLLSLKGAASGYYQKAETMPLVEIIKGSCL